MGVHNLNTVLYLSYDGLLEPLGESQVVSYVERLAAGHGRMVVLSFEKPGDERDRARLAAMEERLNASGVTWIRLRYHKRPPVLSTMLDVAAGIRRGRAVCRSDSVAIVHARGYVPALIALGVRGASGARFLFDMRGFWIDEKVEAGHWSPAGLLYRVGKWWERQFLRKADAIVSLTHRGVEALPQLGHSPSDAVPVAVIPTCVDLDRFTPAAKDPGLVERFGLGEAVVVGSVGTISNWYLRGDMLRFLARLAASRSDVRVLLVSREDHDQLRRDATAAGIPPDRLALAAATFAEMPRYTRLFDVGVFFIRPTLAKRASAATKLAEFLACGVPVVINEGVGDSGDIVARGGVGMVLPSLDPETVEAAIPQVGALVRRPAVRAQCRRVAEELFDLAQGVEKYGDLYRRLAGGQPARL